MYRKNSLFELKKRAEKKFLIPLANCHFESQYEPGTDVMNEDWDNLIILDACRHDIFKQENTLSGQLESRISRGSTSKTFLNKNFVGRELHDTVYVSANPYIPLIGENVFHALLTLLDEWDSDHQTVLPECVVKRAIQAHKNYPNKRLIIHFMQPHQPYIGKKGQKIRKKMKKHVDVIGWEADKSQDGNNLEGIKQIRAPTIDGLDITTDDVFEAYRENLNIVLKHTESLLKSLDGKSVITADHGELIGDRIIPFSQRLYGHPGALKSPSLRVVPWFIPEFENRRETFAEEPYVCEKIDKSGLESKLRALGYK